MIKECSICKRTYADPSITFCLADGSLLSAPFDPGATQHLPVSHEAEPQSTLVVHPPKVNSPFSAKHALRAADIPPTIASSGTTGPSAAVIRNQQNVKSTGSAEVTRRRVTKAFTVLGIFFTIAAVYTQSIIPRLPALLMFAIAIAIALKHALRAADTPPTIASSERVTGRRVTKACTVLGVFFTIAAAYRLTMIPVLCAFVMFAIAVLVAITSRLKEKR